MNDDPGVPGYSTRLELAKAAVAALFEAYQSTADHLHIKVVDFSDTAGHSVWLDSPEQANAYLAKLEANGTTNYAGANGAIPELLNNFNTASDPEPAADKTEVYFISDGKPNPASTTLDGAVGSTTVAAWEQFLTDHNVENAYAIGVGNGLDANNADLGKIASPPSGDAATEPNRLIVTDESQLLATLVGTVAGPAVSGNVLTDSVADVFGADGKGNGGVGLLSIQVGSVTYTYDKALNHITNNFDATVIAGAELIITPPILGGNLDFHFDTGGYTLTPVNLASDKTESFLYTIVDSDGDTSAANLTLTVTNAGGSVVTPLTHIGTDNPDTIDESGSKADIIISGGLGSDTLTGGIHNDHIQGGVGDDKLVGNAGNDVLIGGDGNDTVDAGTGTDFLFGGTGDDLIILRDNLNFGHVDGGANSDDNLAGTNRGDVLAFDGTLDLTTIANSKIEGIETVSMKDSEGAVGNDTLTINASDVIDLGTGHFNPSGSSTGVGSLSDQAAIKVDGDAGDKLNLTGGGWTHATGSHGQPAGYEVYVHDGNPGDANAGEDAYVLVQNTIAVTTS
jgi:hypothetical protein